MPVTSSPKAKIGKIYSNITALPGKDVGDNDQTNANPQRENARHPKTDEDAVVAVHQEPKRNADKQADEGCEEEWTVDFVEHD